MTKRTRTILFSLCVFLFLLITPLVIFYSQGYRFDFNPPSGGKRITQTGGLFLKVEPKQVKIFVNGELTKKTDFFFGSALIENLLPKKYEILVKKPTVPTQEGYQSWEKTLEIKEKEVTEVKNILLIPENLNLNVLVKGVKDFFPSNDEKKVILRKEGENGWYITLFDLEKNVETFLTEGKDLSRKKVDFLSLQWSFDSKKVLLEAAINEEQKYFILELDKSSPVSPIPLNITGVSEKISFDPVNSQKIFFQKEGSLFEIDYETKIISELISTNLITYEASNDDIFELDSSGFLFTLNLSNKNQEKMNSEPFPIKEKTYYQIFLKLPEIFLIEDDSLFRFNYEQKDFEKIFEPIKNLEFSKDSKKMMFFNDDEILVRYLTDILEQPIKKTGDIQLIARFSEKINNCFWLNDYYLIFNTEDKFKIAEIDDRDRIQIWDIVQIKNSKIFFNQTDKKLYILSEGNFYASDVLIK